MPVLANGNVRCHADVAKNLQDTGADGIMSAEGMLDDPTLMAPRLRKTEKKLRELERLEAQQRPLSSEEARKVQQKQKLLDELAVQQGKASGMDCLSVALEYLDLVDQHPAPPADRNFPHSSHVPRDVGQISALG